MSTTREGLAQSVHVRLMGHAKKIGVDPNLVLTRYGAERFLYRLSRSPHSARFVLKGALLLLAWLGETLRPTRDADLLGFGDLADEELLRIFQEACAVEVEPDAATFDAGSVTVEAIREGDAYGGRRITVRGTIGTARVMVQVDVGIGDAVTPDPQQLEQPQQGSHPEGTDVSALEHILQDHQTIPADRGIFLPETWRLAPSICTFTSEVFYEGRLHSRAGLEKQVLEGSPPFEGAGLWAVGVAHEGNQNSSIEEADAVERIVSLLLREGSQWIDKIGTSKPMTPNDILVVAPYNAHVALLGERLTPKGVRVGTVDRFQGQ